jgi:hypothetical protein
MDCKKLEEYANVVVRSGEEKVIIDKDFFIELIKELIMRRRMLGTRGKQRSVLNNRNSQN